MVQELALGKDLKNVVLFSITLHGWGNRRKVLLRGVDLKADKEALRHSKRLLDSPEYKAVQTALVGTREWCQNRSMPSFVRKGVYLVKRDWVERFEAYLAQREEVLKDAVETFLAAYPERITEAKKALGPYFDSNDYPPASMLRERFYFTHSWFKIDVADGLSDEIREQEAAKLRKTFADAQLEIVAMLRESVQELLAYAIERLDKDDDGVPRKFKDSLVERLTEFFETFEAKNFLEDDQLTEAVQKAKELLGDTSAVRLRKRMSFRNQVLEGFKEVKSKVDELVESSPRRGFFSDDDE
jgi:hypothetical protein